MKIATWNVNECVGITCDLDNQKIGEINKNNMGEIIKKINEYDFDVVCFQEYPVLINGKDVLTEQITEQTSLKYNYVYDTYESYLFNGGSVGVAIFSKYKLDNKYRTLFGNPNMTKVGSNGTVYHSFDKAILKVNVSVNKKDYTIITGHAMAFAPFGKTEFDYPESYKPLEKLIYDNLDSNLIVLGDFNSEKVFALMPTIKGKVKDVVDEPTTKDYYEKRGEVQMDYIFINENIKLINKYKIDNFSDHYIISVDVL